MKEETFNSQASQDKFVYSILYDLFGKQDDGFYLEIGAGNPVHINNSYFFEKNLGWTGISIDISSQCKRVWKAKRNNKLLIADATKCDYGAILASFPSSIDYLSLDIDGDYDTVLEKIPFDEYLFKIITIEHDAYRYGDVYRKREREILTSLGYYLLFPDVSYTGCLFEDWWVHPSCFDDDTLAALSSMDTKKKDHHKLIKMIRDYINQK